MPYNKQKPIAQLEFLARLMDDQFSFLGFRFGLNFFLDLIPEAGDVVTTLIAVYIFYLASQAGITPSVKRKMLYNIAVYFIVGLVPWAGDIFGAWYKPNRRNIKLLRANLPE